MSQTHDDQTNQSPVLTGQQLHYALLRELHHYHGHERRHCFLVYLTLTEAAPIDTTFRPDGEATSTEELATLIRQITEARVVGQDEAGRLVFLLAEERAPQRRLHSLARRIASAEPGDGPRRSPALGYAPLSASSRLAELTGHALAALGQAELSNDLVPVCYRPAPSSGWGHGMSRLGRLTTPFQVAASVLAGFVAPFLVYLGLDRAGLDITPVVYLATVIILLITSYLIWYEGFQAIRSSQPPTEPAETYPPASAIVAAYLPNEADTIIETIRSFLERISYPGSFEVILAYNTPRDLPVEEELRALARHDPRLRLLRVPNSTSKAQNVNAALAHVRGSFVGIFDADHHPAPDSFSRAWRWLASGYDIVQGHCVIRNGDESWVTRLVSVEFETIYAVAHPGRAKVHGFGLFGGSNGYWRTELLRDIRMQGAMLTEDIDSSVRALLAGHKIASDPLLLSYELAPQTMKALWNQRLRWAQGWLQVALRHTWPALSSPILSARQKLGVFHLLVWRELYPWLSIQIIAVLTYWIWDIGLDQINLLVPIFVLTTLLTFSSGPGQVLFAYLLGSPTIRRRWHWYLIYLVSATCFYSGLKSLISRVAVVKEIMQEKQWKVTPRAQTTALSQTGASS